MASKPYLATPAQPPLLALPDPCLVAVLRLCAADDQRSLFSAARAHSRLHQAAVAALSSITVAVPRQQQLDSVLRFLDKHSPPIDSLNFVGDFKIPTWLFQLPPYLRLSSLQLSCLYVQFLPGHGCQGVLGAAAQVAGLTKLRLHYCTLVDRSSGPRPGPAELLQLPAGLQHLSLSVYQPMRSTTDIPVQVVQQLQQLTFLELAGFEVPKAAQAGQASSAPPWQALTRLVRLQLSQGDEVTTDLLSAMTQLTHLQLFACRFQPGVLAGKTQLQHLAVVDCFLDHHSRPGPSADVKRQLLSQLQHMKQLTYLDFTCSLLTRDHENPPAAAYEAITNISKLRHLLLTDCSLPAGAWEHMFPAGRQLPQLREVSIANVRYPTEYAPAPAGSRLVSCCPGLRSLDMRGLRYTAELLAPLQELSRLRTLRLAAPIIGGSPTKEGAEVVSQLTVLRELELNFPDAADQGLLLQLTQLQQLTKLEYRCSGCSIGGVGGVFYPGGWETAEFTSEGPSSEPVWRQVLQHHQDMAMRAAAAPAK